MKPEALRDIPSKSCFVAHREAGRYDGQLGVVIESDSNGRRVQVMWGGNSDKVWHRIDELCNGFRAGHVVQDRPRSNTRPSLGMGTVVTYRQIADREMVLVQLHRNGESRWFPFERLTRVRDAAWKYVNATSDDPDLFRLRALAYALDSWNQITGALDRLDVDPLPHQIDLVHRIMTSDHANWLIADDVGLGKTIEVGLLLAAMRRRRQARRVLVVCPAGVVRQWQDEMRYKFGEDFRIYGLDFNISQPAHWVSFDKVIVSIDRAKSETHSAVFSDSGYWDVIVFDEAHHLSKIEGAAITQRYRLAERLQQLTDSFIFLTGTPHQGKTEQFVNLLLLLRPDLKSRFATMHTDPSVVAEVVLRNRKSQVTDASGKFVFRGQGTNLVEVPLSDAARDFDIQLRRYIRHGYAASAVGGVTGRAVGFVMTTYRKLASSSIAAIERALERRRDRLTGQLNDTTSRIRHDRFEELLEAFEEGEDGEDDLVNLSDDVSALGARADPFFANEMEMLEDLCAAAKVVKADDRKISQFLTEIVDQVHGRGIKLLVFTEYRATQDYLVDALQRCYPDSSVCLINGSMSLEEKRRNIDDFNDWAQFMVSTEAGGEGINLHYRCHMLVNYDLPWNPRRLVQRAGRLYRYGQTERVIVFNLMALDGFDNRALGMLLDRVTTIAHDMSDVSSEFHEGLETEIVGDLLDRVDIGQILAKNREMVTDERSEDEIKEAINRAEQSRSLQNQLFSHIEGYDPNATATLHEFGPQEVLSFLEGTLPLRGIRVRDRLHNGRLLELELPEEMRGRYSEFGSRTVVRVTVDRRLAARDERNVSMDFASVFFSDMIEFAKSPEFGGEHATLLAPQEGVLGIYKIRWQNDQGLPRWEMLVPVFLPADGGAPVPNPDFFGLLLCTSGQPTLVADPTTCATTDGRLEVLDWLDNCAAAELAERCTSLRHPNDLVLVAAADLHTGNQSP